MLLLLLLLEHYLHGCRMSLRADTCGKACVCAVHTGILTCLETWNTHVSCKGVPCQHVWRL